MHGLSNIIEMNEKATEAGSSPVCRQTGTLWKSDEDIAELKAEGLCNCRLTLAQCNDYNHPAFEPDITPVLSINKPTPCGA